MEIISLGLTDSTLDFAKVANFRLGWCEKNFVVYSLANLSILVDIEEALSNLAPSSEYKSALI